MHMADDHERRLVNEIRCLSTPATRVFEMAYREGDGIHAYGNTDRARAAITPPNGDRREAWAQGFERTT